MLVVVVCPCSDDDVVVAMAVGEEGDEDVGLLEARLRSRLAFA